MNKKRSAECRRIVLFVLFLCIQYSVLSTQHSLLWAAGSTAAEFLKLGVGARASALQGAYSALADDPTALYWNPAALTRSQGRQASFMHAVYVESTFYDHLAYSHNLGESGTLGAGIQYFSAGSIEQTDETGSALGNFSPSDMALSLGYARTFGGYSAGASLKFIQSKIVNSASALGVDLAAMSPGYLDDKLRLALIFSNAGTKLKFNSTSESLPMALRLGSSYALSESWSAMLDAELPLKEDPYFAAGTEYRFPMGTGRSLAARLGLNTKTIGDVGGFSGLAYGVGWRQSGLGVDYAIEPMGTLSLNHRLSISFGF